MNKFCATCKYEYIRAYDYDTQELDTSKGDEEFVLIQGHFTIENHHNEIQKVSLYACPKCGTVQMKQYED